MIFLGVALVQVPCFKTSTSEDVEILQKRGEKY